MWEGGVIHAYSFAFSGHVPKLHILVAFLFQERVENTTAGVLRVKGLHRSHVRVVRVCNPLVRVLSHGK